MTLHLQYQMFKAATPLQVGGCVMVHSSYTPKSEFPSSEWEVYGQIGCDVIPSSNIRGKWKAA